MLTYLQKHGLPATLNRVKMKLFPQSLPPLNDHLIALRRKHAIEVGGPTRHFLSSGFLPVYRVLESIDNVNFGTETIWEGTLKDGGTFSVEGKTGTQFVREAVDLHGIETESYDVVISSHAIEHIANPIRALKEWLRILKPNGFLLMFVPHKDGTFDNRRCITPFSHLLADYQQNVTEDDLTHAEEFLELFDFSRHNQNEDIESLRKDILNNKEKRRMHHHVFNIPLVIQLLDHCKVQILSVDFRLPFHIITLSRKTASAVNNTLFLRRDAACRKRSPFGCDR
jgi:SAM-dependent methyltransferase